MIVDERQYITLHSLSLGKDICLKMKRKNLSMEFDSRSKRLLRSNRMFKCKLLLLSIVINLLIDFKSLEAMQNNLERSLVEQRRQQQFVTTSEKSQDNIDQTITTQQQRQQLPRRVLRATSNSYTTNIGHFPVLDSKRMRLSKKSIDGWRHPFEINEQTIRNIIAAVSLKPTAVSRSVENRRKISAGGDEWWVEPRPALHRGIGQTLILRRAISETGQQEFGNVRVHRAGVTLTNASHVDDEPIVGPEQQQQEQQEADTMGKDMYEVQKLMLARALNRYPGVISHGPAVSENGERAVQMECKLHKYSFRATKTDKLGNRCTGIINANICYGSCESSEFFTGWLSHKHTEHPVCAYGERVRRKATLNECTGPAGGELQNSSSSSSLASVIANNSSAPFDELSSYYFSDAKSCVCAKCSSSDTSCLGSLDKPHLPSLSVTSLNGASTAISDRSVSAQTLTY